MSWAKRAWGRLEVDTRFLWVIRKMRGHLEDKMEGGSNNRQRTRNVTLKSFRASVVAEEKQYVFHISSVCL
jgi:hypothetical protein